MSSKIGKPVITIPIRVNQRAIKRQEKIRMRELEAKHSKYYKGDRNLPPIITCRRPELNHFKGQKYSPFKRLPMASEQWMSRKTIGDFFSFAPFRGASSTTWYKYLPSPNTDSFILPTEEENRLKSVMTQKPTFEGFDLEPKLIEHLKNLGFKYPTNVQHDTLSPILNGRNVLIASETGNGKTLAYLVPTIQKILNFKSNPDMKKRPFNSPLAVIASPGRELSAQIKEVASMICSELDIDVRFVTGGNVEEKIKQGSKKPVDILVGSVGALNKMFNAKFYSPNFIETVILDEIDTMIDDTFKGITSNLLAQMRKKFDQQLIFAGATLPSNLDSQLGQVIDSENLEIIQTNHLHRILPHVFQKFIRAPAGPGSNNKINYLMDIIAKDVEKKNQVLIFCNKATTSAYVSHVLNDQGISALHFAGGNMHPSKRQYNLKKFLTRDCNILACTDLVSRGIDTQTVNHVINYDFPQSMTDYIHRVGRVGRVGSNLVGSKVTSLVSGTISVALVQEMEKSVRLNKSIPDIETNVIRLMEQYKMMEQDQK